MNEPDLFRDWRDCCSRWNAEMFAEREARARRNLQGEIERLSERL